MLAVDAGPLQLKQEAFSSFFFASAMPHGAGMARDAPEDPDQVVRDVGRMIQQLRRAAGLTQEQMAEKLGVTVRALAYIEAGSQNLTLRTMTGIAAVLGVRTIDLLAPPASRDVKRGRPRKS